MIKKTVKVTIKFLAIPNICLSTTYPQVLFKPTKVVLIEGSKVNPSINGALIIDALDRKPSDDPEFPEPLEPISYLSLDHCFVVGEPIVVYCKNLLEESVLVHIEIYGETVDILGHIDEGDEVAGGTKVWKDVV